MAKTILITGTSSGIGRASAIYFSKRGWNVAATMRNPAKERELTQLPNIKLYALDVTDVTTINNAISQAITDFGGLDVVVNNAGYGAVGIFEKATDEEIKKQFDTNVFGVMNVIRAVLPYFRKKRAGTIINVTSMGGLLTFPIYSIYHASKWAVEGFSESLAYELRPLNIKIKCIEPGAIKTDFYDRSMDRFANKDITDYDTYENITYDTVQKEGETAPGPEIVAQTIFKAANDNSFRLRYAAGSQAKTLLLLRSLLPNKWFFAAIRLVIERGVR